MDLDRSEAFLRTLSRCFATRSFSAGSLTTVLARVGCGTPAGRLTGAEKMDATSSLPITLVAPVPVAAAAAWDSFALVAAVDMSARSVMVQV